MTSPAARQHTLHTLQMTCTACQGHGEVPDHQLYGTRLAIDTLPCDGCEGEGWVYTGCEECEYFDKPCYRCEDAYSCTDACVVEYKPLVEEMEKY